MFANLSTEKKDGDAPFPAPSLRGASPTKDDDKDMYVEGSQDENSPIP
jgi:hypothetical protein